MNTCKKKRLVVIFVALATVIFAGCPNGGLPEDNTDDTLPEDGSSDASGDTTPPSNVGNLSVSAGDGSVTLSWREPDDADFAKVEITYTPGTAAAIEVLKGTVSKTISGLTNGAEYTFTVKSVDTSGNTSAGVSESATPILKPTTFTVTYDGNGNTGGSVTIDDTAYQEEDTVTVLGNTGNLVKDGYTFAGWEDAEGTGYAAGDTFPMGTSDVTLYAEWQQVEKWVFDPPGSNLLTGTGLADDGTIYVGAKNDALYAVNPDGTEKWSYSIEVHPNTVPTVGADGTIYFGASFTNYTDDAQLFALDAAGSLNWTFDIEARMIQNSPAIGTDGTIYVGTSQDFNTGYSTFFAVNPDGTEKWRFVPGGTGDRWYLSPAVGADGTVYAPGAVILYALDPADGSEKWQYGSSDGCLIEGSPSIGPDGTIYIIKRSATDSNEVLHAIDPADGSEKWTFEPGCKVGNGVSIATDGTVYFGAYGGYLYAVNPDGTEKWKYFTENTNDRIDAIPAIGADGTIYFGDDYDNGFFAVNPDGTLQWKYEGNDVADTAPIIAVDGTIYGIDGYELYAIISESYGLAGSSWPRFCRDNRNTSRAQ